jgi:hypothetical protein
MRVHSRVNGKKNAGRIIVDSPGKPKRKRWLIGLILVLLVLLLAYPSWCYGLWGRNSLLMRYLFQCNCPARSEPFRYPKRVEVIVSACQDASAYISPGGRWLKIYAEQAPSSYLIDLQTGKRSEPPVSDSFSFVTDNLLLVNTSPNFDLYLLDLESGVQDPVEQLYPERMPGGLRSDGTIDPNVVLPLLYLADKVFVLGSSALILGVDHTNNYLIDEVFWFEHSRDGELIREYLEEKRIPYTGALFNPTSLLSHSGVFQAKQDGIYLTGTNERIVESYRLLRTNEYPYPEGWSYDDQGVILRSGYVYLVDLMGSLPGFDTFHLRFFGVPQPVLLLKIPEEYLTSAPTTDVK